MTQRANILQELIEIESTLLNVTPQNVYAVPAGYFEQFADQVMNRINAKNELADLSSILNNVSSKTPYSIPAGYFDGLEERLMQSVRESADYQTAKEELESISPLLNSISKKVLFNVPQGYFEQLNTEVNRQEVKVVSIIHRRWFRFAAAAVFVGIVALGALLSLNNKSIDPNKNPDEWVAKNVKKVNTNLLDDFIKLADEENNVKGSVANKNEKAEDIRELMKDVSDKEIQDFLKETSVLENNSLLN